MLTQLIKHYAEVIMTQGGLAGAGTLMALESMIAPVPSEIVMPPLGILVAKGQVSWTGAILASSIGSLVGSLISYYLGYFGGKPLVMKVGKWLLINEHHLDLTSHWFARHGGITVFLCRFIPVVRHFISIPAGIARMTLWKFCLYTIVGATLWNTFLLWLGYKLQDHWTTIEPQLDRYRVWVDGGIVLAGVLAVIAWYFMNRRPKPAVPVASEAKV